MKAERYFVIGPAAGSPHNRYAVLAADGRTVVGVYVSRPDGVEVRRPERLRYDVQPFVGGDVRAHWFNNCPPAAGKFPAKIKDAEEKRQRGFAVGWGRKRIKATGRHDGL